MIYEKTDNFFIQKIKIGNIEESRFDLFTYLCKDKKTLHVGCADALTFDPNTNLHIHLSKSVRHLYGFDTDEDTIQQLMAICPGTYFCSFEEAAAKQYGIVIVPEVLEHVSNAKNFLDKIFAIDAKEIFISVPNIVHYGKEMVQDGDTFTEIVHPDHKCWYSPYTLYNAVRKYIDESKCKMYFLEGGSMVAIHIIR